MEAAKAEGLSLRAIAAKLNAEGHTTRRGRPWNPVQVARVLGQGRPSGLRLRGDDSDRIKVAL